MKTGDRVLAIDSGVATPQTVKKITSYKTNVVDGVWIELVDAPDMPSYKLKPILAELDGHKSNLLNEKINIFAIEPLGNAYVLTVEGKKCHEIVFQNGNPADGINGISNEVLIEILIHRMGVLNDKMPCDENIAVLNHLSTIRSTLAHRTLQRVERGVEGTTAL